KHRSEKDFKGQKHRSRDKPKRNEAELFIAKSLQGFLDVDEQQRKTLDGRNLFIEDRKGDAGKLRYERESSASVPKYRRLGYGEVIGFPTGWKLTHGSSAEVVLRGRKQSRRYTSSRIAAELKAGPSRRLVVPPQPLVTLVTEDYIALPASRSKGHESSGPRPITSFEQNERKDEESDDSSSSLSISEDEGPDEYTVPSNPTSTKITQLTSTVTYNPTSIESWLERIEHSVSTALSAHPTNKFNSILLATYLRSGSLLWPATKLEEEWERALEGVSREGGTLEETVDLWMDWVEWRLKAKGVEGLEETTERIQPVTRREEERLQRRQLGKQALDAAKLRFLWRISAGLAEAGYVERAVAIFQAQIEMTLFAPSSLSNTSFASKLEAFEEFWESEAPRIGEPGARGWCNSSTSQTTAAPPTSTVVPSSTPREVEEDSDPCVKWGAKELGASRRILPLRTADEDEDPHSTILFSDIRPFLWDISSSPPSSSSNEYEDVRILLVLAFIQFLGLHIPGLSAHLSSPSTNHSSPPSHSDSIWSDTRFHSGSLVDHVFAFSKKSREQDWDVVNGVVVARELKEMSPWGVVKEWGFGGVTGSPLEGYGAKGEGRMWDAADVGALGVVKCEIIRNLFQAICKATKSLILDLHWLAFEAAFGVKQALKVSKSILSDHRDSLPRWSAHARLERIRGRVAEARKVYEASLLSRPLGIGEDTRPGAAKMWWDWAEMEWLTGDTSAAQKIIIRAVEGSASAGTISGTVLLKTKKALEVIVRERVRSGEEGVKELVPLVNLQAVLELLAGANPEVALARYQLDFPLTLPPHRQRCLSESLALASTLLLFHHTHSLRATAPPSIFRQHCTSAVRPWPSNTIILGMWLESEKGETVWGRVRTTIREVVVPEWSGGVVGEISRAVWAVCKERVGLAGSEVERARGVLARALNGQRSKSCVALWLIAIELELGMGDTTRAEALLYQAVAECPWAKGSEVFYLTSFFSFIDDSGADLYLLPFAPRLRGAFKDAEMVQWTNGMLERSVRLRVEGVEDVLDRYMTEEEDNGSSDEAGKGASGDHELEELVEERRRLMPY
ncbi:hypothetical protein FRB90_006089, partial [Tulasnella sp. 427]